MTTTLLSRRLVAGACALAAAALIGGCASAPDVPPTLLTLPGVAATPPTAPAGTGQTVALGRLDIPEYLVSRRVRYRTDDSTLAEWPDTFWAERIEVGMSREFTAALRAQLPGWRVCETNCAEANPVASLRIVIERLDYLRAERRLQATARMLVTTTVAGQRTTRHVQLDHNIRASADTPQAQARAYALLLQNLATNAAQAVVSGPPPGASPNR